MIITMVIRDQGPRLASPVFRGRRVGVDNIMFGVFCLGQYDIVKVITRSGGSVCTGRVYSFKWGMLSTRTWTVQCMYICSG